MPTFTLTTPVAASAADLFAWHARPGAFDRLNPPWDPVEVRSRSGTGLDVGVTLELAARVGPARVSWVARHVACDPPRGFVDAQVTGPFASWRHAHQFADGALTDTIDWEVPLGAVGRLVAEGSVEDRIARSFRFRHDRTAADLARIAPYRDRPRLRVAIAGASGFVGTALRAFLDAAGHDVLTIGRGHADVRWDPTRGELDLAALAGVDAVVNLAGEPIAGHRWTDEHLARVRTSRTLGTELLARTIARLDPKPAVFVSASAVGYYGDRADAVLTEASPAGTGVLADVATAWEAAADAARDAGIRVVHPRIGLVLGAAGGVLATLLPVYRAGGGGPLGSGAQWVPWIALDDLVYGLHHAIREPVAGPVNLVAPEAVRQRAFAHTLGRVLGRPAIVPAPRWALAAALGGRAADELLLASQHAVPEALAGSGYRFTHPTLEPALRAELGR